MQKLFSFLFASVVLLAISAGGVFAQSASEIQKKIEDRNSKINELEKEIKQFESNLEEVGREKQTLESAITTLDISRQKISTNIALTQQKIGTADLTIGELEREISEKEASVEKNREALAESLRTINEIENDSLVETVLVHENISDVWEQVETLQRFQLEVQNDVSRLRELKDELEDRKGQAQIKRAELASHRKELSGQKQVLDENRSEKNSLLRITESKEANYQSLLDEKKAAREQFERELQDLEAQLQFTLDPDSIPQIGQGVLGHPLDQLTITQHFGDTPFARSGAYNGKGHNGVDFSASPGTVVRASLSGVVEGFGNTDSIPGCYSYGKWVLIRHNNGLSTLYAHLSVINVAKGEPVSTGEVIGYSGNTGYSTGPHLHYSVYVSDAVQIVRLGDVKRITNCAAAHIPIAPLEAYLNPLDYLLEGNLLREAL